MAGDPDDIGSSSDMAVACRNGEVVWVGPDRTVESQLALAPDGVEIDATGCTVTPGWIDPHAHLPSYGSRAYEFARRLAGASYLEILAAGGGIIETVDAVANATDSQLVTAGKADLDAMLLGGVTTVEAKSGYGLTTPAELRLLRLAAELGRSHPVTVIPTFLGAHAVPPPYKGNSDAFVELLLDEMLPAAAQQGLSEFCDVFCEQGVFSAAQSRRILEKGRELGMTPKLHADEMSWSGGAELAGEVGAASADHLLFASAAGARAMALSGTVGVLLPVTVLSLMAEGVEVGHCRAQAGRLREAGVRLGIGTDYNPGTAPCRSLQLAVSLACRIFGLTPAEALLGVTSVAAVAVRRADVVGKLAPGYRADVTVWAVGSHEDIPYRIGDNLVRDVVKNGQVVVRDGCLC